MSVSMRTTLRTLPRPMWVLVFGTFLNRFGDFVYVFLVLYLTQHGYTAPQAGLAIGSYGVGSLVATSALNKDFPVVQGVVLVLVVIVILVNLAVDVLNALLDPRAAEA